MSDAADFSHNPFAALAQKMAAAVPSAPEVASAEKGTVPRSADREDKNKKAPCPAVRQTHVSPSLSREDDEEGRLFLQAVQNVSPTTQQKKAWGNPRPSAHQWRVEDAVEMPKMPKKLINAAHAHRRDAVHAAPAQQQPAPRSEQARPARTGGAQGNALRAMTDIALDESASADEQAFFRAMREVQPLAGKGREVAPEVEPAASLEHSANLLQDFMDGKLEFALSLTGEYLEGYVVGLDELTMNKLRAGQYSPEAHLDLHGLNALQAYQALVGFFRSAWYKGMRTLLVVPGRGRNSLDGVGVLRDKLQSWLTQEPFKRVVLAFCTARPADGGPGSVYVLLRKHRKKGKIFWERTPADPDLF